MSYGDSVRLGVMADSMIAPGHTVVATNFLHQINMLAAMAGIPRDRNSLSTASSSSHNYQPNIPPDCAMSTRGSNTSVSSASDELRQLVNSSPELNISSSTDTSRSNSPASDYGARSTRSSNEENIFPFTDWYFFKSYLLTVTRVSPRKYAKFDIYRKQKKWLTPNKSYRHRLLPQYKNIQ